MTPVDVSLCAQAYASMPGVATGSGWVEKSLSITSGSARNGAAATALANLAVNSPCTRCWLRSLISPNIAASKKACDPPTPITTS